MTRLLPPITPIIAAQDRQLDTSDSYCCDVPQYIQQAQLMKLVHVDGVAVTPPTVTTLTGTETSNTAVH
jgi:hypothetical protein